MLSTHRGMTKSAQVVDLPESGIDINSVFRMDSKLPLTKSIHFSKYMYACIASDNTRTIPKEINLYKIRLIDW